MTGSKRVCNDLFVPKPDNEKDSTRSTTAAATAASGDSSREKPLKGEWRPGFRLAAALLPLVLVFGLLEGALRVCGYGYPTSFFLRRGDGQTLTSNRRFCWQFYNRGVATEPHPLLVAAEKPSGARRIFVLGESAAEGTPDPAFGFARMLEIALRREYPQERFEVVNTAVRGINSHIILPIARECARLKPDLFVIYMGNNEVTGLRAPRRGWLNPAAWPRMLRWGQWARATKIGQLAASLAPRQASPEGGQDMVFFRSKRLAADTPERETVYENLRLNLAEICAAAREAGAKVVLSTVASNVRDFPPLGSLHREGLTAAERQAWEAAYASAMAADAKGRREEAVAGYAKAVAIDDHFAELRFRLGRCLAAMGRTNQANENFIAARDWDALEFRADRRVNDVIKKQAEAGEAGGMYFLDAEAALGTGPLGEGGIPGNKIFNDHVHFNFMGDHQMATLLVQRAAEALNLGPPAGAAPTLQECAAALAYTKLDEYNVKLAIYDSMTQAPFLDQIDHANRQARNEKGIALLKKGITAEDGPIMIQTYEQALQAAPDDWHLRLNFGGLWMATQQFKKAAVELEKVVEAFPEWPSYRVLLANALMGEGHSIEAARQILQAAKIDPGYPPAAKALAWAKSHAK